MHLLHECISCCRVSHNCRDDMCCCCLCLRDLHCHRMLQCPVMWLRGVAVMRKPGPCITRASPFSKATLPSGEAKVMLTVLAKKGTDWGWRLGGRGEEVGCDRARQNANPRCLTLLRDSIMYPQKKYLLKSSSDQHLYLLCYTSHL